MSFSCTKLKYLTPLIRMIPVGFRGKSRLAKWLFGSALKQKNVTLLTQDATEYLVPSLQEPVGFYLLIDGIYEKSAIDFILKAMPPAGTFLDVGANVGVFAITVAKSALGSQNVIAVEASPKILPVLHTNVSKNHLNNIKIFGVAATDIDDSTVPFYEPPPEHFGMGSLAPQFHDQPVEVKTKTIDTLLLTIPSPKRGRASAIE